MQAVSYFSSNSIAKCYFVTIIYECNEQKQASESEARMFYICQKESLFVKDQDIALLIRL